ncbi:Carboxy-terminal domain RNA polymerase II polypeptide A small phosphatase [Seminavis robusta]|uniref:Carboxy-terminal domain RNA polymerase II polypeptide A small phosphatase n=1 Tax=Seminavis robusta TaxID=568900 RepID=A0A9N8HTF7_9STRA|nr:Carboxy-terminal domain RNA polymerase II polypeptide A small phosphatase [Seminavis robusta]|eukprot:Sro1582_g283810.1 Carboxy-terminal domain RNA polymerase II polypeptide A small phosphatase (404) ;mRNA; f:5410-6717
MTSKAAGTPARSNYENPQSPIASAKRPRSSLERPVSTAGVAATPAAKDLSTPAKQQTTRSSLMSPGGGGGVPMSPMHPPRPVHRDDEDVVVEADDNDNTDSSWVGRKVDALFSPVLSFLSAAKDEDVAAVTDEDATMEDPPKPEKSSDDDTQPTAATTVICKDSSEEEEYEETQEMRNIEEDPSSSFEEEEFNPYLFIKHLPHYDIVKALRPPITLPPKDPSAPPVTLVLDLDETLVHCTVEPTPDADLQFPVVFHGITYQVHVRLRPHLFDFLEKIKDKYEVIVFTASQQVYANELLNLIDPEGKYIHHRLYRESCLAVEGNYLKDLNVLGRDLSKTVLVDNSPHAFGYQVDNGIPIESWFDDPHDSELVKLERFLRTLPDASDVRTAVRWKFQLFQMIDEA